MMLRSACIVSFLALLSGANGFVQPSNHRSSGGVSTAIHGAGLPSFTGYDSFERLKTLTNVPSGEDQRKLRRTVYTHDDWRRHRNQDRFIVYLAAIFKSGVYKNLKNEVVLATSIAAFVCFYNCIVGDYTDLAGVKHVGLVQSVFFPKLGLPLQAFTLTSPSLGLLLVFRTNTSYQRWDEARKNWGMNINHTRDLVRMANAYYDSRGVSPEQRADDLNHVALCTWAFVRAMKRHLSPESEDEVAFQVELYEKLPKQQAEMIIAAAHRPNRALQDLSYAVDDLPMHFMRKNEIHRAVTIFEDNLGSSERILTSPVPLFYSRHLARFLATWLFLLPFGIYDSFSASWNHVAMIPAMTVVSIMLFGIEEIGTQLEEPFTVLPMQSFCDKIYNWCMEIVSWAPGDNGRPLKPIKSEHAFFTDAGTSGPAYYVPPPAYSFAPPPEPTQTQPPMQQYQPPPPPSQMTGPNGQDLSFAEFLKSQGQGN